MARIDGVSLPTVTLRGTGPGATIAIDGVEQRGVTHVSLDVDARDITRVVVEHIAVVDVEVAAKVDNLWLMTAIIRRPAVTSTYTGQGFTLAEALRDIAALVGRDERAGVIRAE